ncbi:MAG: capsule assembly Wzi family protein [Roseivirga sp.]
MSSKLKLFLIFGLLSHGLMAFQYQAENDSVSNRHFISVRQSAVVSGRKTLPFWLVSNNSHRLNADSYLGLWTNLAIKKAPEATSKTDYFYEVEGSAFGGNNASFSLIQAYAGIRIKPLEIHLGSREEFFGVNDSTLSIGNLFYGNNARPIPKLAVKTQDWIKVPFLKEFLSFKAYLAHGWLEEDRYQSNAFLHQKYFYLRFNFLKSRLLLTGGLHHSAQWAGENSEQGTQQPAGLSDFARILVASAGGKNANTTDQLNALGNHLGSYDLSASFRLKKFTVRNYWQFLWEDKSGLTPFNWRDGLFGVSVRSNIQKGIVQGFNLEIIRTNSQDAIKYANDGTRIIEPDNFFNNSVYQSGWTFQHRVIGSPMFLILNPGAHSNSLIKNMVNGYNIGINGRYGKLGYQVSYKYFKNRGLFRGVFSPALKLKSIGAILQFPLKKSSLLLRGVIEWGNYPGKNAGLVFSYVRVIKL